MKNLKLFREFVTSDDINYNQEMRVTPQRIETLKPNEVFVFGSNIRGIHTKGAARFAIDKGWADENQIDGLSNSGQSYGIPTMKSTREPLTISEIENYVTKFIDYVKDNPNKVFYITAIGTGEANIQKNEIAPLFNELFNLENVFLPKNYYDVLLALNSRET